MAKSPASPRKFKDCPKCGRECFWRHACWFCGMDYGEHSTDCESLSKSQIKVLVNSVVTADVGSDVPEDAYVFQEFSSIGLLCSGIPNELRDFPIRRGRRYRVIVEELP